MKKQVSIKIPILIAIIIGAFFVGGAGYFGISKFQEYESEQQNKDAKIQELLVSQQKALKDTEKELIAVEKNSQKEIVTAKLEATKKIAEIQKTTTEETGIKYKYTNQETTLVANEKPIKVLPKGVKVIFKSKFGDYDFWSNIEVDGLSGYVASIDLSDSLIPLNVDISALVATWKPYVVYISCDFKYTNGTTYLSQSGSGTDYNGTVITNKHVITDQNGYDASSCSLKFPGSNHVFVEGPSTMSISKNGDDWGAIVVSDRNSYVNNKSFGGLYGCLQKPYVGDEVIILGYPGIGSQSDITVTRGIISAIEGSYFITDAKIDHGNSGGTAVLSKGSCYLGIPTSAVVGEIESMGRILNIGKVPFVGRG